MTTESSQPAAAPRGLLVGGSYAVDKRREPDTLKGKTARTAASSEASDGMSAEQPELTQKVDRLSSDQNDLVKDQAALRVELNETVLRLARGQADLQTQMSKGQAELRAQLAKGQADLETKLAAIREKDSERQAATDARLAEIKATTDARLAAASEKQAEIFAAQTKMFSDKSDALNSIAKANVLTMLIGIVVIVLTILVGFTTSYFKVRSLVTSIAPPTITTSAQPPQSGTSGPKANNGS